KPKKPSRSISPSTSTRKSSSCTANFFAYTLATIAWHAPREPSSASTGFMPSLVPPSSVGSSIVKEKSRAFTCTCTPFCNCAWALNVDTAIGFPWVSKENEQDNKAHQLKSERIEIHILITFSSINQHPLKDS